MSLQIWHERGRPRATRFLALDGAFHGDTLGATSLGGVEVFRRPFAGVLLDCIHVPLRPRRASPTTVTRAPSRRWSALIEEGAREIAAVVRRAARARRGGDAHLRRRATCAARARSATRTTCCSIVDEVFTGYGRTGPMWACERGRRARRT